MVAYRTARPDAPISFRRLESAAGYASGFVLPCGQCLGCRLDRVTDWQTRCVHEAQMHEANSFVTLTYSDENLPSDYSVSHRALQLFVKRLRYLVEPQLIRFFGCGEYGGRTLRPHYHLIVFGFDFPDRTLWRRTPSGHLAYRSQLLERAWPLGHAEVGTFTPQAAGYVAGYVVKKFKGDDEAKAEHYTRVDPRTGELIQVEPEFVAMSRRPGIGEPWLQKYKSDVYPSDFVIIDGKRRPIPDYYTRKLTEVEQEKLKQNRKRNARKHAENNTDSRLLTRHESAQLKRAHYEKLKEEDL